MGRQAWQAVTSPSHSNGVGKGEKKEQGGWGGNQAGIGRALQMAANQVGNGNTTPPATRSITTNPPPSPSLHRATGNGVDRVVGAVVGQAWAGGGGSMGQGAQVGKWGKEAGVAMQVIRWGGRQWWGGGGKGAGVG